LAQDLDRLLLVTLRLLERALDVHHRCPGPISERLDVGCRDRHQDSPPPWVGAGSGSFSCGWGTSMPASRVASLASPFRSWGCVPSACGWGTSSAASRSASAGRAGASPLASACAL